MTRWIPSPTTTTRTLLAVLLLAALATFLGACSSDDATDEANAGAGQAAALASAPTPPGTERGPVVETMDSGGYTYVCVETPEGKLWAAAPEFSVKVGDVVTFATSMPMQDYHSNTLDRTFDTLYFAGSIPVAGQGRAPSGGDHPGGDHPSGDLPGGDHPSGDHPSGDLPGGNPNAKAPAAAPENVKVDKAEGGITVAQAYAGKGALAGGEVVLRGKVVKVNNGIMGRNWLHIQDGSGGPGTSDLTITTADVAKLGDTVLVRGTLVADKDFGAGYRYEVIVENAAVTIE